MTKGPIDFAALHRARERVDDARATLANVTAMRDLAEEDFEGAALEVFEKVVATRAAALQQAQEALARLEGADSAG